jgi:hypothetical protein
MQLLKQLVNLKEAKNHMGETVYTTYSSWKTAVRKYQPGAWFDGDQDICNAFIGTKPYKRKETIGVGEWDGSEGVVFKDVVKPAK